LLTRGDGLKGSHPRRRRPIAAPALLFAACLLIAAVAASTSLARTGDLQSSREKARVLAADVAALDGRIDAAVNRYSQATRSLEAVEAQLVDNRRRQRLAYRELSVARETLAARAVALYKQDDVGALDALLGAEDFVDLVSQLTMVRAIARNDSDVMRTVEHTKRELADRSVKLAADESTAKKLVATCESELAIIRGRLDERRALLAGVHSDIRRLVAQATDDAPTPQPAVEPPGQDDGTGPWWSLIQATAASNGVSARGMYRLMMIESGGSASSVGPGGYYGLFQYAPATWKGSWNPWRSSTITDGAAQIRATALALRKGYGHAWWDPSYTWAFQGQ
jgi:peptidoglycan hydrolase CwlO-like protein